MKDFLCSCALITAIGLIFVGIFSLPNILDISLEQLYHLEMLIKDGQLSKEDVRVYAQDGLTVSDYMKLANIAKSNRIKRLVK